MLRSPRSRLGAAILAIAFSSLTSVGQASYGIFVGKNRTTDGSTFLAGYGDEPSSHWLQLVPRQSHPEGATIQVGATDKARYPGKLIEIPQVETTAKFITVNYSAFAGFPAPLTNGGLNEHGVAARDVWSPSRDELRRMTPNPQTGPQYSDLSRIVMQRARSAKEAVSIVGSLIDKHGFTTYGGNSHLFADKDEGWILINFAGGKGLWVAERLGPDDIRVSRPGYIGDIPANYLEHPDYMGSKNLITFAVEQGWYDPKAGKPFNANRVYGDKQMRHPAVELMEQQLRSIAKITLADVMAAVRRPELTRDSAGYGQVAHLRPKQPKQLQTLWVAGSTPSAAPFFPVFIGATDVPVEFKRHRYLTEGEASKMIDSQRQGIESTVSAFRQFKRLFYLMKEHEAEFLPEVTTVFVSFEKQIMERHQRAERIAKILIEAGESGLAAEFLTDFTKQSATESLRLAETLNKSLELKTKLLHGIRQPSR